MEGWEAPGLTRLKWLLAGLFVFSMWGLCMVLLKNMGVMKGLWRPVTLVFAGIAIAALVLHGLARWLPVEEASVNLLHAIQYPVLLLVLQAALMLFPGARKEQG